MTSPSWTMKQVLWDLSYKTYSVDFFIAILCLHAGEHGREQCKWQSQATGHRAEIMTVCDCSVVVALREKIRPNTGCPEIDCTLSICPYLAHAPAKPVGEGRDPASGHTSCQLITWPSRWPDPSRSERPQVIFREAVFARGPHIGNGEGAHFDDAPPRGWDGSSRDDGRRCCPTSGRISPDPSLLASSRPQRCITGESQGSWEKDCAEQSGQNRARQGRAETTPIDAETGQKADWEGSPGVEDHCSQLHDQVLGSQAAKTAPPAKTDRSPEAEKAGICPGAEELDHPGLAARLVQRWVGVPAHAPAESPELARLGAQQRWSACHRHGEAAAESHGLGHDESSGPVGAPLRPPRPDRDGPVLRGGDPEEVGSVGDEAEEEDGAANTGRAAAEEEDGAANTGRAAPEDVRGDLPARRRSGSSRHQHSTVVPGQPPRVLGEGRMAGQQPWPVAHRERVGYRAERARHDGAGYHREGANQEPPASVAQHQCGDTG